MLKLAFLVLTGAAGLCFITKQKPEEKSQEKLLGPIPEFNPFPKGFDRLARYQTATVIVHPGYCLSHPSYLVKYGVYGEYDHYLNNLKALVKNLATSTSDLTIFAVSETDWQTQSYQESLSPPSNALTIITRDTEGIVRRYLETPDGLREQKMEIVYGFVRSQGITQIRLAGELAWKDITSGCLGAITSLFAREFRVRGIEGCLYPSFPPPVITLSPISRRLYEDSVKFTDVKR